MAIISSINGGASNDIITTFRGDAYQPRKLVAILSGSWADGTPPIAQLLVNGQVVATASVWARVDNGASQELSYSIPAGTTVTSVSVVYANDLFRSTTEDRNLYVNSLTLNGKDLPLDQGTYTPEAHPVSPGERLMAWNGPITFSGALVTNAMAADTYANSVAVNGGGGLDTVIYTGRASQYDLAFSSGTISINSKAHDFGPDTLSNVERVLFDDNGGWGGGGAASVTMDGNNSLINGGAGIDTVVYNGVRADYSISRTSGGNYTVQHGAEADVLVNVERLTFSDATLAIDVNGNGGMAYRLYQAAFNRTPDIPGLGYQMNALDTTLSIFQVANNFLASPEFQRTYGNLSNQDYVQTLYHNVLHREGEPDGVAYHVHNLEAGVPRYALLAQFSESPENQANVIGTIQNGMLYTL